MFIADTSALLSLIIETDTNHSQAIQIASIYSNQTDTIIIPEDIFSELVNIIGKKFGHNKAYTAATYILSNKNFLIETITEKVRLSALEKFKKQPESVSFTDCVVMTVADYFETKEIFGFDETFHKNGYQRLGVDKK